MIEPVARLRIELLEIVPKVWRRVDVPLSSTLLTLHDIIQVTFGWMNSHLFEFEVGDRVYGDPMLDEDLYDQRVSGSRTCSCPRPPSAETCRPARAFPGSRRRRGAECGPPSSKSAVRLVARPAPPIF